METIAIRRVTEESVFDFFKTLGIETEGKRQEVISATQVVEQPAEECSNCRIIVSDSAI